MNMAQTDAENKRWQDLLCETEGQLDSVGGLISALSIIIHDVADPTRQPQGEQFDALMGVRDALVAQMERAQTSYEKLWNSYASDAPASSAGATGSKDTPIMQCWRAAAALADDLNSRPTEMDDAKWQRDMKKLNSLQAAIGAMSPTCDADWAAKIMNADDGGSIEGTSGGLADALVQEARDILGSL